MKQNLNRVLRAAILFVALSFSLSALAVDITPFEELRKIPGTGKTVSIQHDLYIEGFVISQPLGRNNELNTQRYVSAVNNTEGSTIYIESLDGKYGVRVYLTSSKIAPKFPRYARVLLCLKGTKLQHMSPNRVSILGLSDKNIVKLIPCGEESLPRKVKTIREITDDDVYTYLTLKDCEIVHKDGAFSNVYETYAMRSKINTKSNPNGTSDCWPLLVCDKEGKKIYTFINTLCEWRRDGRGVPKGAGEMKGILAYTFLPRYGGNVFGGYILRPVDKADYAMSYDQSTSFFKSIAEWNWTDNYDTFTTESGRKKSITKERVKADIGEGWLSSQLDEATITRGEDFNNTRITGRDEVATKGERGKIVHGSFSIKTPARDWWDWENNRGKGIQLEFSTEGLQGERVIVSYTFGAGTILANTSYGYPVYWNVEFSTDGKQFFRAREYKQMLRSVSWWYYNQVHKGGSFELPEQWCNYESISQGMGFTEHMVKLPASVLGHKRVIVRIVPVSKHAGTLGYDYNINGALRPNDPTPTYVNFGAVVVRYN